MKAIFDPIFLFALTVAAAYCGYFINKVRGWFTTRGALAVTVFGAVMYLGLIFGMGFGNEGGLYVLSFGFGALLSCMAPRYVAIILKPFAVTFGLLRRFVALVSKPVRARADSGDATHPTSSFLLVFLHTAETFFGDMENLFGKYAERHPVASPLQPGVRAE
ncbi:MAG: hypothetical protein IPM93_21490 [Candidatus Obscuribacter sp.]|nr:hypothetical protein [Candidatus Obscuribacter sp.]